MENYWSPEAIEARTQENKDKLGITTPPVVKPVGTNMGGGTTGATTVTSGETENAFITEALTPSFDEGVWNQDFTKKNPLLAAAKNQFGGGEEEEEEEESSEYGMQADGTFIPYPVDEGIGGEETKIKEEGDVLDHWKQDFRKIGEGEGEDAEDESNVLDYWKNKDFRNLETTEIKEEDESLELKKVKSKIDDIEEIDIEEKIPSEDVLKVKKGKSLPPDEFDDEEEEEEPEGPDLQAMGEGFIDMGKTMAEGGFEYGDIF
jgi:hypothetical protein